MQLKLVYQILILEKNTNLPDLSQPQARIQD
ncbi:Uncharacterised protein [Salmonella enterica subsp. enterica serovar Typhimurium str. DT104]|nr:Uncharacterised protein [Salmonella enterica subsp. enterica serovar Typhimurium str. DT104]